jgi:hypothetical protein
MRSRLPRVGSCLEKLACALLWIAESRKENLDSKAALVCPSCHCFVACWGFGFCRTGLWARPRPGVLGGALIMPRKQENLARACAPPPRNSPGWPWNPAYTQLRFLLHGALHRAAPSLLAMRYMPSAQAQEKLDWACASSSFLPAPRGCVMWGQLWAARAAVGCGVIRDTGPWSLVVRSTA